MDGIGNKGGWAWIFILEGIATVLIGILCFVGLPDSPALSNRWMNHEELRYMEILAVVKNGGRSTEESEKFKWKYVRDVVSDVKMWLQAYILFMLGMCTYGKCVKGRVSHFSDGLTFRQASSSPCPLLQNQWVILLRKLNSWLVHYDPMTTSIANFARLYHLMLPEP